MSKLYIRKRFQLLIVSLSIMLFTACGGSGGSSEPVVSPAPSAVASAQPEQNGTKTKGYLIDSPVEGVSYFCDEQEGLTDFNGTFECEEAPVTFKVGGVTLGTLEAFTSDMRVYPQDLVGVARDNYSDERLKLLTRLLQSLDDDGNIEKKITITKAVRDALSEESSFEDMSEREVELLLTDKLEKSLVYECGALKHLGDKSVNCDEKGDYQVYTPYVPLVTTPTPMPDTTPPVVTLNSDANITLYLNQSYVEQNATATDERDGNVTSSIVITGAVDTATIGTYTLTYTAKDSAGNEANATRTVKVVLPPDTTSPVVTLNGDANITLYLNQNYVEQNATATDERDGNVTSSIVITGAVDTATLGTYTLTYTAKDSTGNEATATRTVNIFSLPIAEEQNLTFEEDSTDNTITLVGSGGKGNGLTYTLESTPTHGTLSGTAPNMVYTPTANYFGTDSFTFKVNDGEVDSAVATVEINVTSVNDAPVLSKDILTVSFDEHNVSVNGFPNKTYGVDMENDGDIDFLVASEGEPLIWYENDGSQNFTEHNISTSLGEGWSVKAIDLEGDGDKDILLASNSNVLAWYENDGSQNFTEHNISTAENRSWWIDSGDIDQDGDIDILSTDIEGQLKWWENDGDQNFTEHNLSMANHVGSHIQMNDLNNDGHNDIVATSYEGVLAWYENDGAQNFTEHNISSTLSEAYSSFIIDMDNDGDKDIIGTGWNMIVYYENDGNQNFTEHNITTDGDEYVGTNAIDIDGDGDIDIFTSRAWFENDGNMNFFKHELSEFAPYFDAIDLDGDGDIDIISPYYSSNTIAWQENLGRIALYVKENNTTVATVVASDVDGDRLTYSISGVDADKFDINATTGVLTFKDAPDYETPTDEDEDNRYEINIAVTDGLETDDLDIMVLVEDDGE